jgi:hypothetical protein
MWDKSEVLWRTCWGTHWELGEDIGSLMGTHWEPEGNIIKTHWELGRNVKNPSPLPQNLKGKKTRHLECMLGPSHWLHEISLPKKVCHHFLSSLTPLAKNTLFILTTLLCDSTLAPITIIVITFITHYIKIS